MTKKEFILSIDQGTSGTMVALVNEFGEIVCSSYKAISQFYPHPGWVEQDPLQIYQSVIDGIEGVIQKHKINGNQILSIGITNQRETTVIWNKNTGKPIHNAIVWECRRTTEICESISQNKNNIDQINKITGLSLDPYFSSSKIKWLFQNIVEKNNIEISQLAFGTIDSWIIWKLTNGACHVTDVTNASRTMLFDIHKLEWSKEMLNLWDVPSEILPEIKSSNDTFGICEIPILGKSSIPVTGVLGAQHASIFGQACFTKGQTKCTYGTGAFILTNTGNSPVTSKNGLLSTIAWSINQQTTYALEGSVFSAGSAVQWLRDEMRFFDEAHEIEKLASKENDNGGIYIVPAFSGLGAPHWDSHARGSIFGLTRGSNKSHIARAVLESIAFQCNDVFKSIEMDSNQKITEIRVDGGASKNNLLLKFQSDVSNRTIRRSKVIETTVLGAAFMSGLGSGLWKSLQEIETIWASAKAFNPNMDDNSRHQIIERWNKAVNQTKNWI